MALILLGQRQHQNARNQGYRSKKLRSQQHGRMKKHLQNFMIGQFKRTFRIIYLDEICFFICICIYGVIFTGNIYNVSYSQSNANQIEKNPGLLIISSLILSNPHLCNRTGN